MKNLHLSKAAATLLLAIYGCIGCKKSNNKPAHYDEVTGIRTWHHAYTSASPYAPYHTTDTLADVQLTIIGINDNTIAMGQDTLIYSSANSINGLLIFSELEVPLYNRRLAYNYLNHTCTYYRQWHVSAGAGEASETYYRP